jgi:ketosteroid isomerase-like protein
MAAADRGDTAAVSANAYSWLIRFAGDKIALLREYFDTNMTRTVLFE